MANLPESSTFDAGVYQIETSDPVLGGPSGVTNTPLKNLANRTKYLKDHVDALESGATVPPGIATEAWTTNELQKRDMKASVRCATTANISLSGLQTIDGVTVIAGDRVLVRAQSAGQDNGIYVAASGAWARAADANLSEKVTPGMLVYVESGTTLADVIYKLTTDAPVTVGYTVLTFVDIVAGAVVPAASETVAGKVELATAAETTTGTDNTRAVHPAGLKVELDKKAPLASPTFTGVPAAPTAAAGTSTTQLATTAFVTAADNLKAPIASPTFTGVPAAPTAAAGTSTTQLATTAFVTAADNLKAPIASPTFTGAPAAPTPAQFDNDTSLATTEFVQRALGNSRGFLGVTTNTTLTAAHCGLDIFASTSSGAITLTLPAANALAAGSKFRVMNTGLDDVIVTRVGTDTIVLGTTSNAVTAVTLKAGDWIEIVSLGTGTLWYHTGGTAQLRYSFGAPFIGVNQTWQDVTGSRLTGTTYTNSTGKPIQYCVSFAYVGNGTASLTVGGVVVNSFTFSLGGTGASLSAIVPNGSTYSASGTRSRWTELR